MRVVCFDDSLDDVRDAEVLLYGRCHGATIGARDVGWAGWGHYCVLMYDDRSSVR